ncbi:hypothetical protein OG21DRAFT_706982 [Imleria badia]|nr:hypothetical protein OG21DRAFT_706982 [Imleria badia]
MVHGRKRRSYTCLGTLGKAKHRASPSNPHSLLISCTTSIRDRIHTAPHRFLYLHARRHRRLPRGTMKLDPLTERPIRALACTTLSVRDDRSLAAKKLRSRTGAKVTIERQLSLSDWSLYEY